MHSSELYIGLFSGLALLQGNETKSISFWPKAISLWHCHSVELPVGWWHLWQPWELLVESLAVSESSSNPRRRWNQDLASPGGPQPSGAAHAGDARGHRSPRRPWPAGERAHPSLQPHSFEASLEDFPVPFFFFASFPTCCGNVVSP